MYKKKCLLYSDGACSGNPGPGGWAYVLAIEDYFVFEASGAARQTTNNRMELMSALEGLKHLQSQLEASSFDQCDYEFIIYSDSVYFLKGMKEWIHGWKRKGWKNSQNEDVTNKDIWQQLDLAYIALKNKVALQFRFVKGHAGHYGNERCDELAVQASTTGKGKSGKFSVEQYSEQIFIFPPFVEIPDVKFNKTATKSENTYYLSMVNGVVSTHKSWADCERAVKGVSGAKFKKVQSQEEENQILKTWGKA